MLACTMDYAIADMTLRYKPAHTGIDLGLPPFNVFDVDAIDLSDSPGRSIFAEVCMTWGPG